MAVFRKDVPSLSAAKSILEIFAPRAAAELERKQEYERLRESEQRYRVFVLLNTDAMWRIEFEQPISTKLLRSSRSSRSTGTAIWRNATMRWPGITAWRGRAS